MWSDQYHELGKFSSVQISSRCVWGMWVGNRSAGQAVCPAQLKGFSTIVKHCNHERSLSNTVICAQNTLEKEVTSEIVYTREDHHFPS